MSFIFRLIIILWLPIISVYTELDYFRGTNIILSLFFRNNLSCKDFFLKIFRLYSKKNCNFASVKNNQCNWY